MSKVSDVVSTARQEYAAVWASGTPPHPGEFMKQYRSLPEATRREIAHQIVQVDLEKRWERWRQHVERVAAGVTVPPAPVLKDYLKLCPELGTIDTLPPDLIEFEFRTRTGAGDSVSIDDYSSWYPHASGYLAGRSGYDDTAEGAVDRTMMEDLTHPPRVRTHPGELPRRFNNYEIIKEIGRGAMGVVYLARHQVLETNVAIKSILTNRFPGKQEVDLFLNEARIAGNLRHENIVRVLEAGEYEGIYYIAMEFVPGSGLDERIREHPLDPVPAARLIRTAAAAMHFAHTRPEPVFHRDLKPGNILVTKENVPYICDFGIAKRIETTRKSRDTVVGTPSYMPPEQALGQRVDARSDVYSLGATLYALLVGRPPFAAGHVRETLRQVVERDPTPPSELCPTITPDMEAICLKCLNKKPEDRYQSAQALADDLDNLLNDRPIVARPPSTLARFAKWKRRNPAMARMVLCVFTLLCIVSGGGVAGSIIIYGYKLQADEDRASAESNERIAQQERDEAETQKGIARAQEQIAVGALKDKEQALIDTEAARKEAVENEMKAVTAEARAKENAQKAIDSEKLAKASEALANENAEKAIVAEEEAKRRRSQAEHALLEARKSEDEAQKQRGNAEHSLNLATELISELYTAINSKLSSFPNAEKLQTDILRDADQGQQRLIAFQNGNEAAEVLLRSSSAQVQRARFLQLSGNLKEADAVFEAARQSAVRARIAAELALLMAVRGQAEVAIREEDEEQRLLEAADQARSLMATFPKDQEVLFEAGVTLNSLGVYWARVASSPDSRHTAAGKQAVALYQESIHAYRTALGLVQGDASRHDVQQIWRRYAQTMTNLGERLASSGSADNQPGKIEEGGGYYLAALKIQSSLLKNQFNSLQVNEQFQTDAARLESTVEKLMEEKNADTGSLPSRELRGDLALTLVNLANACKMLGDAHFQNVSLRRVWYSAGHSVAGRAIAVAQELVKDFDFISEYHQYQTGARYTQCVVAYGAHEAGATEPTIISTQQSLQAIINQEIKTCGTAANSFPADKARFDRQAKFWLDLQSALKLGSK